jgi:hypothetical protein
MIFSFELSYSPTTTQCHDEMPISMLKPDLLFVMRVKTNYCWLVRQLKAVPYLLDTYSDFSYINKANVQ